MSETVVKKSDTEIEITETKTTVTVISENDLLIKKQILQEQMDDCKLKLNDIDAKLQVLEG